MVTLSPGITLIRFSRMRPARWASMTLSSGSLTLNWVLGKASMTVPSIFVSRFEVP